MGGRSGMVQRMLMRHEGARVLQQIEVLLVQRVFICMTLWLEPIVVIDFDEMSRLRGAPEDIGASVPIPNESLPVHANDDGCLSI